MKYCGNKWIVLLVLSITGCKKDVSSSRLQQALAGKWELSQTSSFISTTNWPPGNGNTIQFNNDGHYTQAFNRTDTAYAVSATYRTQQEDHCTINLIMDVAANGTYPSHASVSNDTLYMDAGNCIADGGSSVYLRK